MLLMLMYVFHALARNLFACSKERGSYVINIVIHADNRSMYKIMDEVNRAEGKRMELKAAVKHYFNVVLDRVNAVLEEYNVQVLGDYRGLFLGRQPIFIDPTVCRRPSIAENLAKGLQTQLLSRGGDAGNRVFVYDCGSMPGNEPLYHAVKGGACGHIVAAMSSDVVKLEDVLVEQIYKILADSLLFKIPPISTLYRDNLCKYVTRCAVKNDVIGRFQRELKSVRHTAYIVRTKKLKFIGRFPTEDLGIISKKE
jgi:hypothetical protein